MDDECLRELTCVENQTDSEKSIAPTNGCSQGCTDESDKDFRRTHISSDKESRCTHESLGKESLRTLESSDKESQRTHESSDKESQRTHDSSDKESQRKHDSSSKETPRITHESSGKDTPRTHDSSGKESQRTYVLAADSDTSPASGSRASLPPVVMHEAISLKGITDISQKLTVDVTHDFNSMKRARDAPADCEHIDNEPETALQECSLFAQETFTQTSKTILELAQTNYVKCFADTNAIETQTSRVSIVKNKTIEYRIEVTGSQTRFTRTEIPAKVYGPVGRLSVAGPCHSCGDSDESGTLRIIDDETENKTTENFEQSDASDNNTSKYDSDFTDSLEDDRIGIVDRDTSDGSVPKSVDRDVEELYSNLEKSFDLRSFDRPAFDIPRYAALSPLSEETIARESLASRRDSIRTNPKDIPYRKIITTSEQRINRLAREGESKDQWKLPPISQPRRAGSPRQRAGSPGPRAPQHDARASAWAAGENANLATIMGPADPHRLPSISARPPASRGDGARSPPAAPAPPAHPAPRARSPGTISIGSNIQHLKITPPAKRHTLYPASSTASRSSSPTPPGSPRERWTGAGADVAARGCEALCGDVIARLRQACSCARMTFEQYVSRYESSDGCGAKWAAAVEVLEDIPRLFRGFWPALPEHRVADLLRLVTAQVESPRTRVARAACGALAALLSHTNYTKKPDFDEAVAALLGKTGSAASTLRRAANLALDQVVSAAATAPAITSLCLLGAEHKSGLVRCATARLLVVAAALAGGGRGLLRARPRSVADARRLALRTLAALLDDRTQDTRKYAERLYALLRPLPGFEAFFLADADTRAACRLMKKLDPLLAHSPPPPPPPPR